MAFLRKFPKVVETEDYFSSFRPLFEKGQHAVDWQAAEKLMGELLKGHFIYDISTLDLQVVEFFSQDSCYVATIREEKSKELVGYCTFLVRHTYPVGVVKVMSFAVDPRYQNRGLGRALMFSIFEMLPNTTGIFLATRVTNESALAAYRAWGFVEDTNPLLDHPFNPEHWVFLKYQTKGV
jgi:ribosomal protein S18 acetylase RimI-like enzyme